MSDALIELRANESRIDPKARCGWCSRIVDGDTTSIALSSEAYAAHPDSFLRGGYNGVHYYELFACADGEGCAV